MVTTALSDLEQLFSQALGDDIEVATTTDIAATKLVVSTNLNEYDDARTGKFDNWWVQILGTNNDNVKRKLGSTTYAYGTGTLYVYGANLVAEDDAVYVRVHRYNPNNKKRALLRAIEQLYPALHRRLDNMTLITGNFLPPFNWSTTALLDFYTEPTGTLLKNTTGGYFRNGETSAKVTASGADDYLYISSNDYPRLLDLMGQTVDFKCWVYPEVADDAFLTLYTVQADGTAQSLNSTTTCPAGKWTLLELEDQVLNDDLSEIQFRLRVHTTTKYVYFDPPRATGRSINEYLLPKDFQTGHVSQVRLQSSGYSDDACDDLHPRYWNWVEHRIIQEGVYQYLYLPNATETPYRIRLIGYAPLETLDALTDTISLDGEKLNLIVARAAQILYQMESGGVSSEDRGNYEREINKWAARERELYFRLAMPSPSEKIWTG